MAFSSHDNQFLRGSPSLRRRWLDLTLAAMDAAYLSALQRYTRAVAERNMLLKQGGRDAGALEAFEHELAAQAGPLVAKRSAAWRNWGNSSGRRMRGSCRRANKPDSSTHRIRS